MLLKIIAALIAISVLVGVFAVPRWSSMSSEHVQRTALPAPQGAQEWILGGGCFWCIEAIYDELDGVYFAENGYAGGEQPDVNYQQVCSGLTGHAEVVRIVFDPKKVSENDLLRLFFAVHDPTTLNRQGGDIGTQYRSVIFYQNEKQKETAEKIIQEITLEAIWSKPIVTTVEKLKNYTPAEEYHQDYFAKYEKATPEERSQMNAGYCAAVIEPKVAKFRQKYAAKLKKQ